VLGREGYSLETILEMIQAFGAPKDLPH
jgi:hypothetical protein